MQNQNRKHEPIFASPAPKVEPRNPFSKFETALPSENWSLEELANYARQRIDAFAYLGKKTAQHYWLLGKSLMLVRDRLKRDDAKQKEGNWIAWIERNGFDYYQVSNAIKIAEMIPDFDDLDGLCLAEVRKAIRPKKTKREGGGAPDTKKAPKGGDSGDAAADDLALPVLGDDRPLSAGLVAAMQGAGILAPSDSGAVLSAVKGLLHLDALFIRHGVTRALATRNFKRLLADAKKAKDVGASPNETAPE